MRISFVHEPSGFAIDIDADEALYAVSSGGELVPISFDDEDPDSVSIWFFLSREALEDMQMSLGDSTDVHWQRGRTRARRHRPSGRSADASPKGANLR